MRYPPPSLNDLGVRQKICDALNTATRLRATVIVQAEAADVAGHREMASALWMIVPGLDKVVEPLRDLVQEIIDHDITEAP